jgi:cobalt-zinc-cadmium efflux system protein
VSHEHAHKHDHGDFASLRRKNTSALISVVCLSAGFMVIELLAGIYSGSLALIADSGHMLSDVAGVILALLAIWFASRPASTGMTYGYYRTEILAAFINGVLLLAVSGFILWEAYRRISSPTEILTTPVLITAIAGLVVNVISAKILAGGSKESLNLKGAYLEVLSDLLASAAVIISTLIIVFTGWRIIDPIISAFIGAMILPRTWLLLRECVEILLEGAPSHINLQKLQEELLAVPGVHAVHDLHVWTITSGKYSMSGHVLLKANASPEIVLSLINETLRDKFDLNHTTVQVEVAECRPEKADICPI